MGARMVCSKPMSFSFLRTSFLLSISPFLPLSLALDASPHTMAILAPPQDVSGFDASAVTYTGVWVADAQTGSTMQRTTRNRPTLQACPSSSAANASGIMAINDAPLLGMLIPIDGSTPSVSINQSTHGHGEPIIITTTPKRSCATYNLTLTLGAQQTMKLANFSFEPCIAPSVTLAGPQRPVPAHPVAVTAAVPSPVPGLVLGVMVGQVSARLM
ncbi:hypothetical protein BC834DRAFT_142990 [Gloeopeniophorella convolvens]|nr:hypothetical protein BC834DRAFT_142990 [Gloeopeniophorella convolvens]